MAPVWDGGCGAYQRKKQKKSRRTVCVQRAFAGRPPRDKRAFELEAEKTREARSAPLIAYACRAFFDRSPKQGLKQTLLALSQSEIVHGVRLAGAFVPNQTPLENGFCVCRAIERQPGRTCGLSNQYFSIYNNLMEAARRPFFFNKDEILYVCLKGTVKFL